MRVSSAGYNYDPRATAELRLMGRMHGGIGPTLAARAHSPPTAAHTRSHVARTHLQSSAVSRSVEALAASGYARGNLTSLDVAANARDNVSRNPPRPLPMNPVCRSPHAHSWVASAPPVVHQPRVKELPLDRSREHSVSATAPASPARSVRGSPSECRSGHRTPAAASDGVPPWASESAWREQVGEQSYSSTSPAAGTSSRGSPTGTATRVRDPLLSTTPGQRRLDEPPPRSPRRAFSAWRTRDRENGGSTPRVRSIDGSSHLSASADRLSASRRSSCGGQRSEFNPDDECAEYSDRFLTGYERSRLLGKGACAVVWLAVPTGQKGMVAIKQVVKGTTGKRRSDAESAKKEIFFGSLFFRTGGEPKVSAVDYPGIQHIAKLLDYMETKRDIWLVMEYGGTSLTKVSYEIKGEFLRGERLYCVNHLPVMQAMKTDQAVLKSVLQQLLSALCILTDYRIVHSDIKPDNILVEEDSKGQLRCRFIDFGSAFKFDCPESPAMATPEYMPPEALEICLGRSGGSSCSRASLGMMGVPGLSLSGSRRSIAPDPTTKLNRQSQAWSFDIWSLGSILLELGMGTPLWLSYKCRVAGDNRPRAAGTGLFAVPGRDPKRILPKQSDAIRQRGLSNILRSTPGVPLEAGGLDLLRQMLTWDPTDRISPHEALEHPWLQQEAKGFATGPVSTNPVAGGVLSPRVVGSGNVTPCASGSGGTPRSAALDQSNPRIATFDTS